MHLGKRKFKLLFKFLISYLLILVISLTIGILIYNQTVDMLKENLMEQNLAMLEQSRDVMDRYIAELDSLVERVALDPRITTISNVDKIEEGSKDIDYLISAVNALSAYRMPSDFIAEFYIYLKNSDIIIMSTQGNSRMELIYGDYFSFDGLSYNKWHEQIISNIHINNYIPSSLIRINGKERNVITKLQSIPMDYPKMNRGCIMAFIDTEFINKLIDSIITGSEGCTYILNGDDVITSFCSEELAIDPTEILMEGTKGVINTEISGRDVIISYAISELNGWRYVTVIPSSFVLSEVNYIGRIIIIAEILVLVFGIILSMFFSYKNSKPIREISDILREKFGGSGKYKNEYSFLQSSVFELIDRNSSLKERLERQVPLSKTAFLRRLLYDSYSSGEDIKSNFSYLQIDLEGAAFVTIVIKIYGYRGHINQNIVKELAVTRLLINHLVEEVVGGKAATCEIDETRIALVLPFDTKNREAIIRKTVKTVEKINSKLKLSNMVYVNFAAGGIYFNIHDIGTSFIEAKQALGYIMGNQEKNLVWYSNAYHNSDVYKYTIEMKKRIIAMVNKGDISGVKMFLSQIFDENFKKRKLTNSILKLLIYQLVGTLSEVYNLLGEEYPEIVCRDFSQAVDMEYEFSKIVKAFIMCCDIVISRKNSIEDEFYNSLCSYIDKVYCDESLNLQKIALEFDLKETYLYHFFKEKTGTTFASYIETKRMDLANSLLLETDLTVEEIATKVGYGSSHSFRRAFKRFNGYTPSEVRE